MLKLISFRNEKIQTLPFGWLGALLLLLIVFAISNVVGIVYIVLNMTAFKGSAILQSISMNLGSLIGDLLVLIILYNMYAFQSSASKLQRFRRKQSLILAEPIESEAVEAAVQKVLRNPFSGSLEKGKGLLLLLMIVGLDIFYRLAYDTVFGKWLEGVFPMDDSLLKIFENIFAFPILGILSVALVAPVFEEIVFRGFIVNGLRRKGYSAAVTVVFSALLFAVFHLNILQGVNAFILGIFLALIYEWTNDLRYCIALHLVNNTIAITYDPVMSVLISLNLPIKLGLTALGLVLTGLFLKLIYQYTMAHNQKPFLIDERATEEQSDVVKVE